MNRPSTTPGGGLDEAWLAGPTVTDEPVLAARISSLPGQFVAQVPAAMSSRPQATFRANGNSTRGPRKRLTSDKVFAGGERGGRRCAVQRWERRAR